MNTRALPWIVLCGVLAGMPVANGAAFDIELETGAVWQTRNDVAIPGDTGTRVAFDDLIGHEPAWYYRVYIDVRTSERHAWRLLYAPLELEGTGQLEGETSFAGAQFAPGPVHASYRFNSYRLTWRYRWHESDTATTHVGLTAKIRDARVALRQGTTEADDENIGFVPLLHVDYARRWNAHWSGSVDVDASAAPQGRAIDLALKAHYAWSPRWTLSAGYRTLEGGADNDTVYAFAWLHYLVLGAQAHF